MLSQRQVDVSKKERVNGKESQGEDFDREVEKAESYEVEGCQESQEAKREKEGKATETQDAEEGYKEDAGASLRGDDLSSCRVLPPAPQMRENAERLLDVLS